MASVNRSNCVPDSPPIQPKDTDCTQVIKGPLHTHKQSKSSTPKKKRARSRSQSKPAKKRKTSTCKSKRSGTKERKVKKCKVIVRKVCKLVKSARAPSKPKASSVRPRAIKRIKKSAKSMKNKKIKINSGKSKLGKLNTKAKKPSVKSKAKSFKRMAKKQKKRLSVSKCPNITIRKRPRSHSGKPKTKKAKLSVSKLSSLGNSLLSMASARVSTCVYKHVKKSPKVKATRGPTGDWSKRLRPRPLKTARFPCYSQACLSKNIEQPKPKVVKKVKSEKKKPAKVTPRAKRCGKNANNQIISPDESLQQSLNNAESLANTELEDLEGGSVTNNHCSFEISESNTTNVCRIDPLVTDPSFSILRE